ncbi:hypothetical protein PIB30_074845 [Stylosanthes scabra]|uniref:Uncharacterized protein n=1 Tax=Stylosanthes scabra TaxID=79078 RepID=A0ABU6QPT1_9FABA|nr:hypothetical protein [Stylosanthes scabra]
MANKNGIKLAIAVLMSLAIFCTAIDEFYETTIPEDTWIASYFIASNFSLDDCVRNCKVTQIKQKSCMMDCIKRECMNRHPNDEKKRLECIDLLKAQYNIDKLLSELQFK